MLHLLFALALAAPAPLRLGDLLREARDKNPDLKAAQARIRAAKSAVAPAGALDDPMLMVQLWNAPVDLSSVPVMVQLTQPLPLGGKRGARRDAALADQQMAEANLGQAERDTEVEVAKAYFDLFLAEHTQRIDDEVERLLQLLIRTAEARVATGKAEQVELLRAQGALVQLKSDRETATDHRASAWARIAALLDRDPAASTGTTTEPRVLASLPELSALRDRALRERPELAGTRASIAGASAQARLAKAADVPDIALQAAAMHTFGNPGGPSNFFFAGVQVNLPIFQGGKNGPRIESANAQIVAAQEAEHALKNRIASQVAEGYAHLLAEGRQIELHHQLIPLARLAIESAQNGYVSGRSDFNMVIDSARELRMHELELAQHLAMYEQRLAELQRAVGADLGLVEAAEGGHEDHR